MSSSIDPAQMRTMANAIRALSMDAVQKANSGHPGMPMGMADVATVLWTRHLKFDPKTPKWPDRDRFVLSAGHGSMLVYSLLHLSGLPEMTMDQIRNFRQMGSLTPGHPEYEDVPGIEMTTGPLGQGISTAVGMALAERHLNAHYGDELVDHYTWVIASDGDLQEGISHEAISLAGHLKLNRLIVLWDDNEISIDGGTSLSDSTDHRARFEAAGWTTLAVDGHDPVAIDSAMSEAKQSDKPVMIACRTTIGFGAPNKAGTAGSHGAPLGEDEIAGTREALRWDHPPFEIPDDIRSDWKKAFEKNAQARSDWSARLARSSLRDDFNAQISGDIPTGTMTALKNHAHKVAADKPALASRASSGKALDAIARMPGLIGGSADLSGSNNTHAEGQAVITADDYSGHYINYGIREHGMAALANGMSLHGGIRPYVGTFLIFSDYCRPSIRLAALMHQPTAFVFTHDSIGLGEDGPTHQPVEHLSSLRAMPNVEVYRPCDALETAEAWRCVLERSDGPSLLALSRQKLPHVRSDEGTENRTARGGYVLAEGDADPQVVLIGTGSEVELALKAQALLASEGIASRVVSMPCVDRFLAQDASYQSEVLPDDLPRVAVEAGVRWGWDAILGREGGFVGMTGFGGSAPADELYVHFGITAEAVAEQARQRV